MTIRVLVVDDAVVIRRILVNIIDADPELEVVGTASNGRMALAKIDQLDPDIVTLDVEMPELDGLSTLIELRKTHRRLPVIMFSTLTARGLRSPSTPSGRERATTSPSRPTSAAPARRSPRSPASSCRASRRWSRPRPSATQRPPPRRL